MLVFMAFFRLIICDIFLNFTLNIYCSYLLEVPQWGGSNEYSESMFLNQKKKNNIYPHKPHFGPTKAGFSRMFIIRPR